MTNPICPWCKGERHPSPHCGFRRCPIPTCDMPGNHEGRCLTLPQWLAHEQVKLAMPYLTRAQGMLGMALVSTLADGAFVAAHSGRNELS